MNLTVHLNDDAVKPVSFLSCPAIDALRRELKEELGCRLVNSEFLGFFAAPAANEPMHSVEAALFQVVISGQLEPQAEIEEIVWVDPAQPALCRWHP
jgi:8-oxo-dGTP diphosphatase